MTENKTKKESVYCGACDCHVKNLSAHNKTKKHIENTAEESEGEIDIYQDQLKRLIEHKKQMEKYGMKGGDEMVNAWLLWGEQIKEKVARANRENEENEENEED